MDHANQDAHRHACHRHQDAGRHQGRRSRPRRARSVSQRRSRLSSARCRTPAASSPSASWAATTSSSMINRDEIARYGLRIARRAGRAGSRPRRHAAHDHGRGTRTLHRKPAIRPRFSREPRGPAANRHPNPHRRADATRPTCRNQSRPRPYGHQERRRHAERMDLRGRAGHRHRHLCADGTARRATKLSTAAKSSCPSGYNIFWSGQYEYMLRAKQRLADCHPAHAADHRIDHLSEHKVRDQNVYRDARGAVLTGRRVLDALSARLQPQRRRLGRHHRPRRPRCRDRRRHAALPRPRVRAVDQERQDAQLPPICATPSTTAP